MMVSTHRTRPFVVALLALLTCLVNAAEPRSTAGADASLEDLALPAGSPERFEVLVRLDGAAYRSVRMQRHSLRAPAFRARAYRNDRITVDVDPGPPLTYRGTIVGMPGAWVLGNLRPEGLDARVFIEGRPAWTIRALPGEDRAAGAARHEVRSAGAAPEVGPGDEAAPEWCAVEHPRRRPPPSTRATAFMAGDHQHLAEIALDLDYTFLVENGGTVEDAIAAAEAQLNIADFIFARDTLITYTLTHVIVRTDPFYEPGGTLLNQVAAEWNANQTGVPRDTVHMLAFTGGPGGVSMGGTVCDLEQAYSWSSGPAEVMVHEFGHNWNAYHCHDYVPCNSMCDICLGFEGKTRAVVESFRDALACLDEAGPYDGPLPPHADRDSATITRDEIAAGGVTRTVDVLSNDADGNLEALSIAGFDATTDRGGTVTLSPGTGSDGRDELIYTPAPAVFPGDDRFRYAAGDTADVESTALVGVRVLAPSLDGYWKLDGNTQDSSGGARNGFAIGGVVYVAGVYGQAAEFNGTSSYITIPGLKRDRPSVTISAWVRRNGVQPPFAGIFVGHGVNGVASLSFGEANELRHQWGEYGASATDWDSGLVVPDLQWVFVALVVEPDQATIYLHDGTGMQSAQNVAPHPEQDFQDFTVGWDPFDSTRRFKGRLDDVRIYDYALTATEVEALRTAGGGAYAPEPYDGGGAPPGYRQLKWGAGIGATSHDLYFGGDYAAVRDATPSSAEFRGNQPGTSALAPPPLVDGHTYYWRVDEVTPAGKVTGPVWVFSVEPPLARWALDELAGTTAADAAGRFDGTYSGSPALGLPAAQPELVRSISLDGVDDAVVIPPLGLDDNEVTFSAWVRRDGTQAAEAGIWVSRSASTVAGIRLAANGKISYKWNDIAVASEEFSTTGLIVPDSTWSLLVLAVGRDQIDVYLNQPPSQSLRHTRHRPNDVEAFDGPFHLGRDPGLGTHFKGRLDDVRIYPFTLTPSQVAALFTAGRGAGRVPNGADVPGAMLTLDKSGATLLLSWAPSCVAIDLDYAVYEGPLGDFASRLPATCSTGGAPSASLVPQPGNRYFLVVPLSTNREGGYGIDSGGDPRAPSPGACRVSYHVDCD